MRPRTAFATAPVFSGLLAGTLRGFSLWRSAALPVLRDARARVMPVVDPSLGPAPIPFRPRLTLFTAGTDRRALPPAALPRPVTPPSCATPLRPRSTSVAWPPAGTAAGRSFGATEDGGVGPVDANAAPARRMLLVMTPVAKMAARAWRPMTILLFFKGELRFWTGNARGRMTRNPSTQ